MTNKFSQKNNKNKLSAEKYAYLKAEAQAPYKGLRKFIYLGIGTSGAIGGFIFLLQLIAQKNITQNIGNLLVQVAVVSLMIFLYRWEDRQKK